MLLALPKEQVNGLEGIMQAITQSTERIGWSGLVPFAAVLLVLSSHGSVAAWLAAMSRIPFVVGIDRFLPPAFARLHPRWGTPYVPLLIQGGFAAVFIFLGQAGTSVRGAYDVLLSMTIIVYFMPYVMVFAALVKLQSEPAGPEVIRVPGGKPVAILVGWWESITSVLTIIFSAFPPAEEPHKGAGGDEGSCCLMFRDARRGRGEFSFLAKRAARRRRHVKLSAPRASRE